MTERCQSGLYSDYSWLMLMPSRASSTFRKHGISIRSQLLQLVCLKPRYATKPIIITGHFKFTGASNCQASFNAQLGTYRFQVLFHPRRGCKATEPPCRQPVPQKRHGTDAPRKNMLLISTASLLAERQCARFKAQPFRGRDAARCTRQNIASGSAVRFESGQQRTVELVDDAGYSKPPKESGFVKNTIAANKGRFLCAFTPKAQVVFMCRSQAPKPAPIGRRHRACRRYGRRHPVAADWPQ